MFETGMSALVLKICSEYAKSLGLNFPPCTQQEINAICQWVDKHAVKDMTISQDGYTVTFTFKGEYDTTKEFTITIPKTIDVEELAKVLVGSESVVVERLENNSGLRVRLDQSVLDNINSKLTKPTNPSAESAVTMLADGTVGTKLLSEIGGGKLYKHHIALTVYNDKIDGMIFIDIYSNSSTAITLNTIPELESGNAYIAWLYNPSYSRCGVVGVIFDKTNNQIELYGAGSSILEQFQSLYYLFPYNAVTRFIDTVTEL